MKKTILALLCLIFSFTAYAGHLGWIKYDRTSTLNTVNWGDYNLVELTAEGIKVKIVNASEWFLTPDRECELVVPTLSDRIQLFEVLSQQTNIGVFCFVSDYRENYVKTSDFKVTSYSPKH